MVDQLVAASNFAAWISLFFVAGVLWIYLTRQHTWSGIVSVALAGAAIEATGWAFNRFYWWLWWYYKSHGHQRRADWLVDNAELTLFAFVLIFAGAAMLMAPLSAHVFGRHWPLASVAFFAALLGTGFYIAI